MGAMQNPIWRLIEPVETLARPHPTAAVTRIREGAEVPDPSAVGVEREDVEAIWRSVVDLYRSGLHPAIALCLRRRGEVLLDRTIGHPDGGSLAVGGGDPARVATPDSLFNLFSASKAITAMVIHLLDDRGEVHLDDAVAEYIPEFARHGKERITLRHVLTHRAGLPAIPGEQVDLGLVSNPTRIIELLCEAKPTLAPGRRLAYHALTGGFLLGEVVRRVTGRPINEVLRREFLDPLGIRNLNYGVPADRLGDVVKHVFTGPPIVFPYDRLIERALGVPMHDAIELSNDPRFLSAPIPAGNIVGTADEACRFYEMLRCGGELAGVRVLDPRTVRRATGEQSYLEADLTLVFPVRYGLGFMLGSKWVNPYGLQTEHAFGHLGFTNVITWADPEREISAAILTSGKPLVTPRALAWLRVMWTIARRMPRTGSGRVG